MMKESKKANKLDFFMALCIVIVALIFVATIRTYN